MSNTFLLRLSGILIITVLILLYVLGCNQLKKNTKIEEQSNLISALGDTLKLTRYADSSQKATIQSFSTKRIIDFTNMNVKDSIINALQSVVKQYKKELKDGGSAIVYRGEVAIQSTGPTIIEHTNYDTINNPVFPIYGAEIDNKWYNIKIRARKDSVHADLKIINDYTVILGKEKGVWFANVINHNPYSVTKSMRSYNVIVPKIRQKRVNLAVFGGYGGCNTQGTIRTGPIVGVGISYTILSLF
jgi:hypothetical protein